MLTEGYTEFMYQQGRCLLISYDYSYDKACFMILVSEWSNYSYMWLASYVVS